MAEEVFWKSDLEKEQLRQQVRKEVIKEIQQYCKCRKCKKFKRYIGMNTSKNLGR